MQKVVLGLIFFIVGIGVGMVLDRILIHTRRPEIANSALRSSSVSCHADLPNTLIGSSTAVIGSTSQSSSPLETNEQQPTRAPLPTIATENPSLDEVYRKVVETPKALGQ